MSEFPAAQNGQRDTASVGGSHGEASPKLQAPQSTATEAWCHECEVRMIAAMESDERRRLYLDGVHQKRGKAAWQRLRYDVWKALRRVA